MNPRRSFFGALLAFAAVPFAKPFAKQPDIRLIMTVGPHGEITGIRGVCRCWSDATHGYYCGNHVPRRRPFIMHGAERVSIKPRRAA